MTTIDYLINNGWKEYPDFFRKYSRHFAKRFDTPTRCYCNNEKSGIQVTIHVLNQDRREGIQIELCGELKDGNWIKLTNYSFNNIEKAIDSIPRLIRLWEEANK